MQGIIIIIVLCIVCFLAGVGIGVAYSKKIRREIWEQLERIDKKIDEVQKKVR